MASTSSFNTSSLEAEIQNEAFLIQYLKFSYQHPISNLNHDLYLMAMDMPRAAKRACDNQARREMLLGMQEIRKIYSKLVQQAH